MVLRSIIVCVLLFTHSLIEAQHDSYIHYTRENGLPSSNIYTCTQDIDGFMWFGTDNGLSRFDGQRFYNYSLEDGLTDNEVLQLVSDKQSGIWGVGLDRKVFYYGQGKFYTQFGTAGENENINFIIQDPKSGIWAIPHYTALVNQNGLKIFYVSPSGKAKAYHINTPLKRGLRVNNIIPEEKAIHVTINDSVFVLNPQSGLITARYKRKGYAQNFSKPFNRQNYNYKNLNYEIIYMDESCKLLIWGKDSVTYTKLYKTKDFPSRVNNVSVYNDNLYLCFQAGGYAFTDKYLTGKMQKLLNNVYAGYLLVDKYRNLWICSSSGLYYLQQNPVKIIDNQEGLHNVVCHSVMVDTNDVIYIGTNLGYLYRKNQQVLDSFTINKISQNERVLKIISENNQKVWYGTDKGVFSFSDKNIAGKEESRKDAIKNILITKDKRYLYASTHFCIKRYLLNDNEGISGCDTILTEKIYGLAEDKEGNIWMGGKKGLFCFDGDKTVNITQKYQNEKLKNINRLAFSADSILWIGTNGEGLIAFKNNRILTTLKKMQGGISDNMCTALFVDSYDNVWLGTKKGLNRIVHNINQGRIDINVIKYGIQNGLSDDEIQDVFVKETKAYIATSKGINILDFISETSEKETQKVHIWQMKIGGKEVGIRNEYIFPMHIREFGIQYSRLCFNCSETPIYEYRIFPEQSTWNTTIESSLNYQSLGYGEHRFEIRIKDNPNSLAYFTVSIPAPWWKTFWFLGLITLATVVGIVFIVNKILLSKHNKEVNDRKLQQQIMELEMKAIRAQMNPHFIFNSLGAIQYYFNTGEKSLANTYMIKFAELIRSTLYISEKSVISLSEEIKYITTYLELEKMRFEDLFDFYINVESGLDTTKISFPSLLLQPYLENAIKHGIQNNPSEKGILIVRFYSNNDNLLISEIEDNGIGMKKAKEINQTNQHLYESRGMDLSANRIKIINRMEGKKITLEIMDKRELSGQSNGTLIRITMPVDLKKSF